ncbi:MAG: DUF6144 family protein [Caldisericia bacterium]|nr:DUF6144 family protein [Caldisericia bacterium]
MKKNVFKEYYQKRNFDVEKTNQAIAEVEKLETYLHSFQSTLETATPMDIQKYVSILVKDQLNHPETLLALARYFLITDRKQIYIYFTSIFGGCGVIENIRTRLESQHGKTVADDIFCEVKMLPLGTPLSEMPLFTKKFMNTLEEKLPARACQKSLAGNNHEISKEGFLSEKEYYEKASSLDAYLLDRHHRMVAILQEHCDENKVWFEQIITQDVVDFVQANPEMLSAVRRGSHLYITKIPYDTVNLLKATEENQKKYYLCHCPFVRESLLTNGVHISPNWCYCSGGFAKVMFEVLFDTELDIEVLETPLKGDNQCRFRIPIPPTAMK